MSGSVLSRDFVGRGVELGFLRQAFEGAVAGKGSTVLVEGDAGVGKSRLVGAFREMVDDSNISLMVGSGDVASAQPFLPWSKALVGVVDEPLFEEQELTRFVKIFAVNQAGLLVAQAVSEEGDMDGDIFAGMLSAVQSFVKDSLGGGSGESVGLGRLEYGDLKILIEHGQHLFLTGVFAGAEHPDMRGALRRTLHGIEEKHGDVLAKMSVNETEVAPVQEEVAKLADTSFLVKRDLEGVKLENERIRIADRVLETLKEKAKENTLVVLLEDLHWVDESSLFVLQYLARNIKNSPILLVGTHRPQESKILEKTLSGMEEEKTLEKIVLGELSMEDTKGLVDALFSPNHFPETLLENLFHQSKGNPLFVTEILKSMREQNSIRKDNGVYILASEDYVLPSTVEEVVNHRLDRLDMDSMAMAEYASCIGECFDAGLAASNRLLGDSIPALKRLFSSGILLERGGRIEFSHAIFQDVIYRGIGERWKIGYHKNIGEHLETTYGHDIDCVIYDVARHFSITREYEKTARYSTKAGEKAESAFAMEQAAHFYKDALKAMENIHAADVSRKALDIKERLGDIASIIGDYTGAMQSYLEVKEAAATGREKVEMLAKISFIHERMGDIDRMQELIVEAKSLLGGDDAAESGKFYIFMGMAHVRKGEYQEAMMSFTQALDILAETSGEGEDVGRALLGIGNAFLSMGDYDKALDNYGESMRVMERIEDDMGVSAALGNAGIANYMKGNLDAALELFKRCLEIRSKVGDRWSTAECLNNMGETYYSKGELEMALEHLERSLEMAERFGQRWTVSLVLNSICSVHRDRGDYHSALVFGEKSLEMSKSVGDKMLETQSYCNLAVVNVGLGHAMKALEYAERAKELAVNISARGEESSAYTALGMAHRALGQPEMARECFEISLSISGDIGKKKEHAFASYEYGLLMNELGKVSESKKSIAEALEEFSEMGVRLWAEKCRMALGKIDAL